MLIANAVVGSIVLFLGLVLASSAGIGGGGITLPILMVIFGFDFTHSVVLSLCAVLGNIISQFGLNFNARHPEFFPRPLIYWEAVLILLPAQLAGSSIGVLLSEMAPNTALKILAMATLLFAGVKTLLKGLVRYQQESLSKTDVADEPKPVMANLSTASNEMPLLCDENSRMRSNSLSVNDDYEVMALQSLDRTTRVSVKQSPAQYPWAIIRTLVCLWIANASLLVSMTQFGKCSWQYFLLLMATFPLLLSVCVGGFFFVIR
jgi:hypothetical protein